MDFTLVADCGSHAIKYSGQAKRSRRKDWSDGQVKDMPPPLPSPTTEQAESSRITTAAFWQRSLSALVEKELEEGEELTLVLLLDTFAPRHARENLLQYGFEHLGAEKMALCNSSAAALFAAGDTSGVGVDVGYSGVRVTPVERGVPLPWLATSLSGVGGAASDAAVGACVMEANPTLSPSDVSRMTSDPAFAMSKTKLLGFDDGGGSAVAGAVCEFPLPDGGSVSVSCSAGNRARATRPLLFSSRVDAPASFARVYQKYCVHRGEPAGGQWVCFGGGAAVAGVGARLGAGLAASLFGQPDRQLTVRNPLTAAVEGAKILTHLNSFKGMCLSAAEYAEDGPSQCVHVKTVDPR